MARWLRGENYIYSAIKTHLMSEVYRASFGRSAGSESSMGSRDGHLPKGRPDLTWVIKARAGLTARVSGPPRWGDSSRTYTKIHSCGRGRIGAGQTRRRRVIEQGEGL